MSTEPLLTVNNLVKRFPVATDFFGRSTAFVSAVDDVSLQVQRGETLALVGESGSGKSTLARLVLRLIEPTSGSVRFDGQDVLGSNKGQMQEFRRKAQIIFQDPFESLDPRMKGEVIVAEGMPDSGRSKSERKARVAELLDLVQLPADAARRFPHEFSGGQRQRLSIARALAVDPIFVVADEPVSALDVSMQSQILNLMRDLQDRLGLTYLFISHDMSVIRHMADRVAVMYLGQIVEIGPAVEVFSNPVHPYTQTLLSAVPSLIVGGTPPTLLDYEAARAAIGACTGSGSLQAVSGQPDHMVACFGEDAWVRHRGRM
ncbi:MAG: ATP-binding cassette domain-containing protein [Thermomicrobiales bacterium]|nr:ATP-binding cassette domain-containing protein [Thermomicrobiales bacterium]